MRLYVDGGGTPTVPTYFSYLCPDSLVKSRYGPYYKVQMERFLLFNLNSEHLPENCYVVDDRGLSTNNIAEYCALFYGLKKFIEVYGYQSVTIFQDSELIVRQVNGQYRCKQDHLVPWLNAIKSLWYSSVNLQWVPRKEIAKVLGH